MALAVLRYEAAPPPPPMRPPGRPRLLLRLPPPLLAPPLVGRRHQGEEEEGTDEGGGAGGRRGSVVVVRCLTLSPKHSPPLPPPLAVVVFFEVLLLLVFLGSLPLHPQDCPTTAGVAVVAVAAAAPTAVGDMATRRYSASAATAIYGAFFHVRDVQSRVVTTGIAADGTDRALFSDTGVGGFLAFD